MIMLRPLPTILACCALLASGPLMAQSPQEPAQDALALLQQAIEAKGTGNHAAALDAYNKAAAVLAQDPAQQDGWGLLLQADLQRDIARAVFAARAGDPCPSVDRGKAFLDRARTALAGTGDATIGEAVDGIEQSLKDQRARMGCGQSRPTATVGKPDAASAGHYYLSGVMETGSELLLKPDGRFDWYISYGAVDQVAKGRWGRDGQTVTLAADVPQNDGVGQVPRATKSALKHLPRIEPAAGRPRRMMIMAVMGMVVVPVVQILSEGIASDIYAAESRSGHGEPGGRVDGNALVREGSRRVA